MTINKNEIARQVLEIVPLIARTMGAEMRQLGPVVQPGQFALLRILSEYPITQGTLADKLRVSPPTMSATIDALVRRGWVNRQQSAEDRRVIQIEITAQGRAVLEEMDTHALSKIETVLSSLDEEELVNLSTGMQTLQRAFLVSMPPDQRFIP